MYVATTGKVWNEISNHIDKMFEERIKYANSWYNYGITKAEFDKICLDYIRPDDAHEHMKALGKRYFMDMESITVTIVVGPGETYSYNVDLPPKTFLPNHWQSSWDTSTRPKVKDERLIALAVTRKEAMTKVTEEKEAFVEKIRKLYNSAPSVNALDKTWPAIRDLLDPATVRRLDEKSKTARQEFVREKMGTDEVKELSVHMLKAKVAAT